MKRSAMGFLSAFLLLAGWGTCAADTLGIYADNQGIDCNIVDHARGLLMVHVVHISPAGTTASQFSAPKPACMTGATWLSDVVWVAVGNSQVGIAVPYGQCLTGTIHVMSINYFAQGTSETCCAYPILPDPYAVPGGQVIVADCDNHAVSAEGLIATVNGDATCVCGYPVPVEETTWGRVKALYTK